MADDHSGTESHVTVQRRTHYSPPWADVSIIGIAGSSGSGKSTLSHAIAIDFNVLVQCLRDLKAGCALPFILKRINHLNLSKRAEVPVYSFAKHQRLDQTTTIYSPHVIILEGIFALHDPRIIDLLDMRVKIPISDQHMIKA
ncbi:uridine kinase [Colletotrichum liriopes]|uniref:Uridine kinase n=1 Tax=Colletotrichum liriopes TaxID=708192 RepID=A0AA37LP99_9PEZI|nr:uridine kinase [Colletotrichum liriopes]